MGKLTLLTDKDRGQWNIIEHNLNQWQKIRLEMLPERNPQFADEVKAALRYQITEAQKLIGYVERLGENPTMDELLKSLNKAVHANTPTV